MYEILCDDLQIMLIKSKIIESHSWERIDWYCGLKIYSVLSHTYLSIVFIIVFIQSSTTSSQFFDHNKIDSTSETLSWSLKQLNWEE